MLKRKEVTADQVSAKLIDLMMNILDPQNAYTGQNMLVTIDNPAKPGEAMEHSQSVNDTLLVQVLSTMLYKQDKADTEQVPYKVACSGREIDRIVGLCGEWHASQLLPCLVDNGVLFKHANGYSFTDAIYEARETIRAKMEGEAPFVKTPLRKVLDWQATDDGYTGVAEDSRFNLISSDRGSKPSQSALDAVNNLQSVQFVVSDVVVSALPEYMQMIAEEHANTTDQTQEGQAKRDELETILKKAGYLRALQAKQVAFSFGVTFDWRLRMYYQASVCQPQGTNMEKAAHQFAHAKPMNNRALQAVQIVCANELGRDKLSINDRIKYMEKEGLAIAEQVAKTRSIKTLMDYGLKRDKCFTALVNCCEYIRLRSQYVKNGKTWRGITSTLVCHQDGTCNGIQHAAALLQDRATAVAVNCVKATNDNVPSDIYGLVANGSNEALGIDLLTRKEAKKPVMVTGYGASQGTVCAELAESMAEHNLTPESLELVQTTVLNQIGVHAAAVVTMTAALSEAVAKWLQDGRQAIAWRTPDGSIVKQVYKTGPFVVLPTNYRYSLSKYEKTLDADKMARAVSPNFIHSLDACHLRNVVNTCKGYGIDLVTVHDSIGSHPANFHDVAEIIRVEFVALHQTNPLEALEKWNGETGITKTGDYDVKEVLESPYFFS